MVIAIGCRMVLILATQFTQLGWHEIEFGRYRWEPRIMVGQMNVTNLVQGAQRSQKNFEIVIKPGVIPICAERIIRVLPKGTPA